MHSKMIVFLRNSTNRSADLAGVGVSLNAHEIGGQKVEGAQRLGESSQICTPI